MAEAYPDNTIQPCKEESSGKLQKIPYFETIEKQLQFRTRQAQRSDTEATVFLYGKSGAGKSTTINYLFHTNIVPTSKFSSGTQDVTEYACSVKNSRVFQSKLKMNCIDTPGFGETQGREPEHLAKISHFVDSKFSLLETFPSIVLIAVSAEDNRMGEIDSMFSRMLHVLSKLNVVDRLHPNVVIVVTHAMYFIKEEYDENSKQIEKICKALARAHFSIEVPVVFIENLDKREEMEQEGDWKILPDGTKQPLNLFEAMIHLMKQSGDEVGVEAVRLLFSESSSYEINKLRRTAQDPPETDYSKWKQCIDEIFFPPTPNSIYSTLVEHIGHEDIQIFPLVYHLYQINFIKPIHLRTLNLIKFQQKIHPFQLTDEETDWLVLLFEVSRIKLNLDFSSLGLGYSRKFKEKRNRILQIGRLKNANSGNYSMEIPESCSVKDLRKIVIDIVYDENTKWWLMKYLKITFRIYYVLFQVDIDNLENFRLNEGFISALKTSLPKGVDPEDIEYKFENLTFSKFVKDYGLRCTTGLYFGGFVEGNIYYNPKSDEETSKTFLAEKSAELLSQLNSFFACIRKEITPNKVLQIGEIISSDLRKCDLTWRGGKERFYSNTLLDITAINWNNWINSIGKDLVCLDPKMINSTSLYTILSSSLDQNIRLYAREFSNITTKKQTELTDLQFEGSFKIVAVGVGLDSEISCQEEKQILTRIEASDRAQSYCTIL